MEELERRVFACAATCSLREAVFVCLECLWRWYLRGERLSSFPVSWGIHCLSSRFYVRAIKAQDLESKTTFFARCLCWAASLFLSLCPSCCLIWFVRFPLSNCSFVSFAAFYYFVFGELNYTAKNLRVPFFRVCVCVCVVGYVPKYALMAFVLGSFFCSDGFWNSTSFFCNTLRVNPGATLRKLSNIVVVCSCVPLPSKKM